MANDHSGTRSRHGLGAGGWDSAPRRPLGGPGAFGGPRPWIPSAGAPSRAFPSYAFPVEKLRERPPWYRTWLGAGLLVVGLALGWAFVQYVARPLARADFGTATGGASAPVLRADAVDAGAPAPPGFERAGSGGVSIAVPASWSTKTPDAADIEELPRVAGTFDPDGKVGDLSRADFLLLAVDPSGATEVDLVRVPEALGDARDYEGALRSGLASTWGNLTSRKTTVAGRPGLLLTGDRRFGTAPARSSVYAVGTDRGVLLLAFTWFGPDVPPATADIVASLVVG